LVVSLLTTLVLVLGFAGISFGADIEFDPASDSIIIRGEAAKALHQLLRDGDTAQMLVESLKAEISKRLETLEALESENMDLKAALAAREKESVLADFIVKNYEDMRRGYREELAEARLQRQEERAALKAIIESYQLENKELRKDLRWARISSIAGIVLAIFTFGIAGGF
jgi:hypothetical protein